MLIVLKTAAEVTRKRLNLARFFHGCCLENTIKKTHCVATVGFEVSNLTDLRQQMN
jgi:hypothetical protein